MRLSGVSPAYFRTPLPPQEVRARLAEATAAEGVVRVLPRRFRYQGQVSETGFFLFEAIWDETELRRMRGVYAIEGLICAAQEGSLVCVRASNGFSPYVILSMMAWVFAFISMFGSKVASVICTLFMFLGLFIAMLTCQKRRQFVEDLCALLDGERLRGGKALRTAAEQMRPLAFKRRQARRARAPWHIHTPLTPQEACARLAAKLSADERAFVPPEAWYCGSISPQDFRLRENVSIPGAGWGVYTGKMLPCEGGAQIEVSPPRHRLMGCLTATFVTIYLTLSIYALTIDARALFIFVPAVVIAVFWLPGIRLRCPTPFVRRLCALLDGELLPQPSRRTKN